MRLAAIAVALVLSTCDGAAFQKKEEFCACTMEMDPVCEKNGKWHLNPTCARCAGADDVNRAYCEDFSLPKIVPPIEPADPCDCTVDLSLMCGNVGHWDYPNGCSAECNGLYEYIEGLCVGYVGTNGLAEIGDDAFDDKRDVREDDYDVTEMCACPRIYAPVCGTDGHTYGNSCEADCKGVEYTSGSCDGEWESRFNQGSDSTGSESDDDNYSDDADTDEDKKALRNRH